MTIKLNSTTRKIWAEKTFELTNIGAGITFFGQFVSGKKFSLPFALLGLILVIIGYIISYLLTEKK